MTSDVDRFLAEMLPRQIAAERAIHEGDAEPRMDDTWSHADPVTVFGAWVPVSTGWTEVSETFKRVAARFSESREYEYEVIAAGASGGLAYTVGYEHNQVTNDGKPVTYTLRATHVYRHENGEWKIVHRHADYVPAGDSGP